MLTGMNKFLSRYLTASQIGRVYTIGGIALLLVVCVVLVELTTPEPKERRTKAEVKNIITDESTRNLGVDAVNAKVTGLQKRIDEFDRLSERLLKENERLSSELKEQQKLDGQLNAAIKESERLKKELDEVKAKTSEQIELIRKEQDAAEKTFANINAPKVDGDRGGKGIVDDDSVKSQPLKVSRKASNSPFSYGNESDVEVAQATNGSSSQTAPYEARTSDLFSVIESDVEVESQDAELQMYLPKGSMLTGVLMTGVDAPTASSASDNPTPVLVRVKKEAILPNYFRLDEVRECFVLMSGYGELSSERAHFRGESISCVREDGEVIEEDFKAFAVGEDGKAGLKGTLVTRNGAVLANALMAGFANGLASAFNVTPVATISTDSSGQQQYQDVFSTSALQGGAATGASESMERLADYYMDMADEMHPVIEVGAGRVVDMVITKGTEV